MNRREFTARMARLISQMVYDGNEPVIDYILRSTEEQQRLFAKGLSKCDGVTRPSDHQKALAFDLYFVVKRDDGSVYIDFNFDKTSDLAEKYHTVWESWGGKPMIEWDKCHYGAG